MYIYYNPNPEKNHVGDCVVRALTVAFDESWDNAFIRLMAKAYEQKDMPSSNSVWGSLLTEDGFKAYMAIRPCETCLKVKTFATLHPKGLYILATGSHVVALKDGNYMDSWDSGDETVVYYFSKEL